MGTAAAKRRPDCAVHVMESRDAQGRFCCGFLSCACVNPRSAHIRTEFAPNSENYKWLKHHPERIRSGWPL
jgi:hypothetical protein